MTIDQFSGAGQSSAVGQSVPNRNLRRFVEGHGRYAADLKLPDALVLLVARSPVAHARLIKVDGARARALDGVELVLTGADMARLGAQPSLWDLPGQQQSNLKALAEDRLRYVGQPYAAVVARDLDTARQALRLIVPEYEMLPVLADMDAGLAADAVKLYDHWPDNVMGRQVWKTGDFDACAATAAVVVKDRFTTQRVHALSLEPRGVVAVPDAVGNGLTVWVSTQSVHQVRGALAGCLNIPEHHLRVIAPDVGGSFGMKACAFGEETLVALAALKTGRAVRWHEQRAEAFVASTHGRDERVDLEAAFAADGQLLGLRATVVLDKGADPYATSMGTAWITGALLTGPYAVDLIDIETLAVVTNKTPTGAYRGFGQPEANFALERALDLAAHRLGLDRAAIRRRNLVPESDLPKATPTGIVLDSGNYVGLMDQTLAQFGYEPGRVVATGTKRRGQGFACYSEVTNFGPSALCKMVGVNSGGFDISSIRMEPSGHVRLFSSQTPMGQGIETVLTQICADELGVPLEDVEISCGDSLLGPYTAYGSGGSRGAGVGGASVMLATRKLALRLRTWGAHLLGADLDDVVISQRGVQVKGEPTRRVSFADIGREAYFGATVPEGLELGLEDRASYDPPGLAVSYGTVAVEIELDTETGVVTVERMTYGHDCGIQINPEIVDGQVIGAAVQAIGATLYEELHFDAEARPLILSMQDYFIPFAADVPNISLLHRSTPTPFSPTGVKGVGESGIIAVPAAIASAVQDAMGYDVALTTLPLSPPRLFAAMKG
ncbi:xanthine dehydrogenase family protein molybdopterin-binding subunit [Govanella unica]|uniref:Xanthine dehydrogenase family protein molybdopterin-binding subunit n=1 Tax=Govanella unica TaxID=2975056 RepID=A0A9X3Z7D7_9PROT|nr:xanthine dehydrogenase family protein molybdopterin-binding subunit [Govania unica]MDA5194130.1 xanthine dehydrogenase family protein molybdopterin-binding subunit [Govania unica]